MLVNSKIGIYSLISAQLAVKQDYYLAIYILILAKITKKSVSALYIFTISW